MKKRPQIAAIVTEYRKYSHGQHIVDRFLEGYGWNSRHHYPPMDLISIYVDRLRLPPYIATMAVRLLEIAPPPPEEIEVNINTRDVRPDRDGAFVLAPVGAQGMGSRPPPVAMLPMASGSPPGALGAGGGAGTGAAPPAAGGRCRRSRADSAAAACGRRRRPRGTPRCTYRPAT